MRLDDSEASEIGSFQLVHELNGDGVELDMGSLGKGRTSIISCVILISTIVS